MISQRFSQIFCFHGTAHTRYSYPVASAEKRFSEEMESLSGKREAESDYANYHQMPLPHCNHTSAANMPERKKFTREETNAQGDKNCPRQKMSEKKNYQEMMLPLQPHLSRKYQNTGTFHPKGGISLQSAPKEEVRIRYLIFVISYTNTIMSKLFF